MLLLTMILWSACAIIFFPDDVRVSSKPCMSMTNLFSVDQVKSYRINTAAGADMTKSVGPSAEFLQMPIAYNYRYVEVFYYPAFANSLLDSSKTPTSNTPIKASSTYRDA